MPAKKGLVSKMRYHIFLYKVLVLEVLLYGCTQAVVYAKEQGSSQAVTPDISTMNLLDYEILMFEKRTNQLIEKTEELLKQVQSLRDENDRYKGLLEEKDAEIEGLKAYSGQSQEEFRKLESELAAAKVRVEEFTVTLSRSE